MHTTPTKAAKDLTFILGSTDAAATAVNIVGAETMIYGRTTASAAALSRCTICISARAHTIAN